MGISEFFIGKNASGRDFQPQKVYVNVVGDNEAQIPTLHMLISLENTLGQLLDKMETLPVDVVAQYEKKFEKDRRARLREEKVREQEMLQKERVRKALERAQAAPRTQVGRRPVKRKWSLLLLFEDIAKCVISDAYFDLVRGEKYFRF